MNILEQIVEKRRARVEAMKREYPLNWHIPRNLMSRKFPSDGTFIIAECKKASPSKGVIMENYYPASLARDYEDGGASAISVLTEEDFFSGSIQHIPTVRNTVKLPVLRKDFIIDSWQVRETVLTGADAMLLIVSILDRAQLKDLHAEASGLGLAVLVEAHNEAEVDAALECGAGYIGVNARNLKDFSVSTDEAARLARYIPGDRIAVAESGINSVESLLKLRDAGYRGFLIGEHFMTADDPAAAVRRFRDALDGKI